MSNKTERDAFWDQVYNIQKKDGNVVIVSADMGAPALDRFRRDFPNRFINAGIAEQNAILISSGLALTGQKVFAYAIAPFITLRCIEQTRVNSGIMNIPITMVGVSGGFGYVDAGPTHHSTEDLAMMRAIPHITIQSVSDNNMAIFAAQRAVRMNNTYYVRLDRQPFPDLYTKAEDFSKGCSVLRKGDFYIIATGNMTHLACQAADILKQRNLNVGVIDLYEFPILENNFIETIFDAEKLITLEEHFYPGGLGGAVAEVLMDRQIFKPLKRIALPVEKGYCYEYGARESLQKYYGVDLQSVVFKAEAFIAKKLAHA